MNKDLNNIGNHIIKKNYTKWICPKCDYKVRLNKIICSGCGFNKNLMYKKYGGNLILKYI